MLGVEEYEIERLAPQRRQNQLREADVQHDLVAQVVALEVLDESGRGAGETKAEVVRRVEVDRVNGRGRRRDRDGGAPEVRADLEHHLPRRKLGELAALVGSDRARDLLREAEAGHGAPGRP